jgi:hypothetical protein
MVKTYVTDTPDFLLKVLTSPTSFILVQVQEIKQTPLKFEGNHEPKSNSQLKPYF